MMHNTKWLPDGVLCAVFLTLFFRVFVSPASSLPLLLVCIICISPHDPTYLLLAFLRRRGASEGREIDAPRRRSGVPLLWAERSTRQGVDRGFLYCARSQRGENRSLATVLLVPDVLTRLRGVLAPARDRLEAALRTHIHRRSVPSGAPGSFLSAREGCRAPKGYPGPTRPSVSF
jgi:hypothetical protein